ncbi:filaggrin-like [Haliotis asinina]|uniref:filaggrin-like n=1 Tax=Haliotis asinina TaxID=109174 RepID=UPI003531BABC
MIRIWMLTWPLTPHDPKKKKSIEKTPLVKADSVESYESVEVPVSDDRIHPVSSGRRSEDQTSLLKPTGKTTQAPNTYKENGYLLQNGRESTLPLKASDSREDKIVPDTTSTLNANPPNKAGSDGLDEEDRQRRLHSSPDKGLEKSGSDSRHDGLSPPKQTLFQMANNRRNSGQNDGTEDKQRTLPASSDSKLRNYGNGYQAGDETSLLIGPGNSRTPGGKDDRGNNSGSDGPNRYGAIPGERDGNSHSDIDSGDSSAAYPNSDSSFANGTEDRDRHMSPDSHAGDERDTDGSWSGDKASLLLPPSGRRGSNVEQERNKNLKSSERRDKELPSNQSRGRRLESSPGRTSKSRSPSLNSKRPNDKDKQPVKEIPLRKEKPPVPTVKKLGFGSTYKQPKPQPKDPSKDSKKRKGSVSKTPQNPSEVIEPEMVRNTKTQRPVSAAPPEGKRKRPGEKDNSTPGHDISPGATEAMTPEDGDIDAEAPLTFLVPDGRSQRKASYPQEGYLVLYNDIEDSDDREFVDEESSTDIHTLPRRPKLTSEDAGQGRVDGEGRPLLGKVPGHLDLQFDAGEVSDDPYDDHGPGPGPRGDGARGPGGSVTERRELQGQSPALHTQPGGGGRGYDSKDVDGPRQNLRRPAVEEVSETANAEDAPHRKLRGAPKGTDTDADPPAIDESTPVAVKMAAPRGAAGSTIMDDPRAQAPHGGMGGAPTGKDAARLQRELQGSEPATLSTVGGDADSIGHHDEHGQPLRRPVVDEDSVAGDGGRRTKGSPTSLKVRRAAGDDDVIVPEDAQVSHAQLQAKGGGRGGDAGSPASLNVRKAAADEDAIVPEDAHVSRAQLQARGADTGGRRDGDAELRNGKDGAPPGKDAARSQRELHGSGPATFTSAGGDADSIGPYGEHGQPLRRPVVDEDSVAGDGGRRTKGSPGSLNVRRAAGDEDAIVPEDGHVSHAQLQARGVDTDGGHGSDAGLRNGKDGVPPGKDAARSHRELQGSGPATFTTAGGDADSIGLYDQQGQPLRRPVVDEDSVAGDGGKRTKGSPSSLNARRAAGDDDVIVPEDAQVSHAQMQAKGVGGRDNSAELRNGKDGVPQGKDAARSQRELQGSEPATFTTANGDADSIRLYDEHGNPLRRPVVDEDSVAGDGGRRTKGSPGSLNVRRAVRDGDAIVPEDAHVSHAQLQATGAGTGEGDSPRSLDVRRAPGDDDVIVPEDASVSHSQYRPSGGSGDNDRGRNIAVLSGNGKMPDGQDTPSSQRQMDDPGFSTHIMSTARPSDRDGVTGGQHGDAVRRPGDSGSPAHDTDHIGREPRGGMGGAPPGKDAARSQRELQGSGPTTLTTVGGDADSIGLYDEHGQPLRRPVADEDSVAEDGGRRTKGSPGSLNVRRAGGDDEVIVPEDAHVSYAQLQARGASTGGRRDADGDSSRSLDVRRAPGDDDVIVPEDASVSHSQFRPSGGSGDNGRGRNIAVLSGNGKMPDGQDTPSSQRQMDDPGFSTHIMSTARPSDRDGVTGGQQGDAVRRPGDGGSPAHDTDHAGRTRHGGVGGAPPGKDAPRSQRELQGSGPATFTTAGVDADSIRLYDEHGQPLRRPVVDEDSVAGEGGRRTKGSPGSLNVRRAVRDGDAIVPEDAHVSHAQLQATGASEGDSPRSLDVRRAPGDDDVIVPEDASVSHSQFRPSGGRGDNGRGRHIAVLSGNGNMSDGQDTPSSQRQMDDPGFSTHIMSTARPSDRDGVTGGQHGDILRRPGDGGSPAHDTDHAVRGLIDAPDRGDVTTDQHKTLEFQKPGINVLLIEKGPMTPGERRHEEALKMNAYIDRVHIELPPVKLKIIIFVRPGCWSLPYNEISASGTSGGAPAQTQQKRQNVSFSDTPDRTTTHKWKSADDGEVARKRKTFARVSRKGSRRLSRLRSFKRSSSLEDVENLEPVMPDLAPVEPADKRQTMMKKTRSLDALDDDQPIWLDRHRSIDLSHIEARREYTRELEIIQGDSVKQLVKGFEDYSRRVSRDWTASSLPL